MAAMTTILASTGGIEQAQGLGGYSQIEGEILVLLRRPARFPTAIKEIQSELSPLFSKAEIWKRILDLLEDGMIRPVYTSGYEIGLEWA